MKAGDLCRVIKEGTHRPCQYGQYVIVLSAGHPRLKNWLSVINQTTGKWHHHHRDDLEVVCK